VGPDCVGIISPLVDFSVLVVSNTEEFGVWVLSGEVFGDGRAFEEEPVLGFQKGELSG